MDTKEITVSDLAQDPEVLVLVRPEWLSYFKICLKNRERNHLL